MQDKQLKCFTIHYNCELTSAKIILTIIIYKSFNQHLIFLSLDSAVMRTEISRKNSHVHSRPTR